MRSDRRDPLHAVARALADGEEIDWAAVARSDGGADGCLEEMRMLDAIARACAAPLELPEGPATELEGWGALRIRERVGAGGFGEVYRAFDTVLHREVALKLRKLAGEEERAAFESHLEEARRLARVRHPNVLAVYGVEIHEGRAGMWTDFIRGETLEDRLTRDGPLPAEEVVLVGLDLCAAIGAVHDAGLIHGDIKTANAMREESGRTILMDFGAGIRSAAPASPIGASPQGTPIAMAPELIEGGPPSVASDLYSLGVLLYRLATGRYPITASSWSELVERHRTGTTLPVRELRPDLPLPLSRVIDRCLATAADARPDGAAEVEAALRACGGTAVAVKARADQAILGDPPSPGARFIGRREELLQIRRMLLESRLITLTGSGGCGKTRLAHRAAEEVARSFRDGAHWADLSAMRDPALLPQTVARAFGLSESRRRTALDQLHEHVRDRRCLLVLDNCEHVNEPAASLAGSLLDGAPGLRILATSREPFGVEPERTLRVPSLPLPTPAKEPGLEILESEAVRLFVDRAVLQVPGFAVTPAAAPAIDRIVRRLDGIPLAIELAAARLGALTVDQLADRLDEGFRLLAGRETAILPRRQTIRASIEWSHALLLPDEQRCLARTSVFSGGWTLEAAEAICAGPEGDPPVIDLLETLVRRSIVQFDSGTAPRYRLLGTVREFAREKLRDLGEESARRREHLRWFLHVAAEAGPRLRGPDADRTAAALDAEVENVRAALAFALEEGDLVDEGLRLCTAMSRYWFLRESCREGGLHFSAHLTRGGTPSVARGRSLVASATVLWPVGDLDGALRSAEEGLAMLRAAGDHEWVTTALATIGFLADLKGDAEGARRCLTEAFALYEAREDVAGMARVAGNLGVLESRLGDHDAAVPHYERAIPLLRRIGDEANAAVTMRNLSYSLLHLGENSRARTMAEEGIGILRRIGQRRQLAPSLCVLADIHLAEERTDPARRHALEALHLAREAGEKVSLLAVLTTLGVVAFHQGCDERAVRLLGAVSALHDTMAIPIGAGEQDEWDRRLARLRERTGAGRFDALWAEGRALDFDAVLGLASE